MNIIVITGHKEGNQVGNCDGDANGNGRSDADSDADCGGNCGDETLVKHLDDRDLQQIAKQSPECVQVNVSISEPKNNSKRKRETDSSDILPKTKKINK